MHENASEPCSCSALRQASRHVTRLYDEALAPAGLGLNQYAILANLQRLGPSTIQALAKQLVMDRSTLGHLLRPLQARGLLNLENATGDRRARIVAMSPAGIALVEQARPMWATAQDQFERVFGADNATGLRAALKRVVTADFRLPATSTARTKSPGTGADQT